MGERACLKQFANLDSRESAENPRISEGAPASCRRCPMRWTSRTMRRSRRHPGALTYSPLKGTGKKGRLIEAPPPQGAGLDETRRRDATALGPNGLSVGMHLPDIRDHRSQALRSPVRTNGRPDRPQVRSPAFQAAPRQSAAVLPATNGLACTTNPPVSWSRLQTAGRFSTNSWCAGAMSQRTGAISNLQGSSSGPTATATLESAVPHNINTNSAPGTGTGPSMKQAFPHWPCLGGSGVRKRCRCAAGARRIPEVKREICRTQLPPEAEKSSVGRSPRYCQQEDSVLRIRAGGPGSTRHCRHAGTIASRQPAAHRTPREPLSMNQVRGTGEKRIRIPQIASSRHRRSSPPRGARPDDGGQSTRSWSLLAHCPFKAGPCFCAGSKIL